MFYPSVYFLCCGQSAGKSMLRGFFSFDIVPDVVWSCYKQHLAWFLSCSLPIVECSTEGVLFSVL